WLLATSAFGSGRSHRRGDGIQDENRRRAKSHFVGHRLTSRYPIYHLVDKLTLQGKRYPSTFHVDTRQIKSANRRNYVQQQEKCAFGGGSVTDARSGNVAAWGCFT